MALSDEDYLREFLRRKHSAETRTQIDFRSFMFPQQRAFVDDRAKRKSALCTRRAGKSSGTGLALYEAANKYPELVIPYISLTRKSAKNIMWPVMRKLQRITGVEAELLDSSLTVKMPNKAEITLFGADQVGFADRIRGGAYPLVVIDESQSFREHLSYLVDDVLDAAFMDYDGTLLLVGTPGPVRAGYFFEVTEEKKHGFSNHRWSVYDNPHMPNAKEWVENRIQQRGLSWENPTVQREWLGQWVDDPDATVYKFKKDHNEFLELPQGKDWYYVIGVDYGWNDETAFSVLAYNNRQPLIFVVSVEGHGQMIPSRIAERLQQLIDTYSPIKIVADTGGLGKSITEEMKRRYSIPIEAAQKTEKLTWISLLNGELIDGKFKVHAGLEKLKDQYLKLTKDEDGLEDPNLPNDLCDSVLYAFRAIRAYAYDKEVKKPATQAEKHEHEERALLKQQEDLIMEENKLEWWEQ